MLADTLLLAWKYHDKYKYDLGEICVGEINTKKHKLSIYAKKVLGSSL
jgi:hypothetical protein